MATEAVPTEEVPVTWTGVRSAPLGSKRYLITPPSAVPEVSRKHLLLQVFHSIHEDDADRLKTVLFQAAEEGYNSFVDDKRKRSGTPLMWCSMKRASSQIMQTLLEQSPNLTLRDGKGETALMKAALHGCAAHATALLQAHLAAGIAVNDQNDKGQTALILACQKGYTDVVQAFLSFAARTDMDLDLVDADENTALMTACQKGFADVVTQLLTHPKPPNTTLQRWNGMSALMLACRKAGGGGVECVRSLLQYSQDVGMDLQDEEDGSTALQWCLFHKNFQIAEMLLAHTPRPSLWIINDEGWSAVDAVHWKSKPKLTAKWKRDLRVVLYQQIEPAIRDSSSVQAASQYIPDLTRLIVCFIA